MIESAAELTIQTKPQEQRSFPGGEIALAYLQLLRLPNLPTAIADVMMGVLVTQSNLNPPMFGLVAACSALLYLAGMVLNDVFDADVDAKERSERPIPSGRISLATAKTLGWGFIGTGVVLGWAASFWTSSLAPGIVATLLAASVVAYDGWLKRTILGPVSMGLCRTLNVLLGASLATQFTWEKFPDPVQFILLIAIAIGTYIAGVTWFARSEAKQSSRTMLVGGLLVLLVGLLMIGSLPAWQFRAGRLLITENAWYFFWAVVSLIIARRFVLAIVDPTPSRVQAAIKNGILSLIVIDAGVTVGYCGVYWGCAVLLLLAPAVVLGKWIYST